MIMSACFDLFGKKCFHRLALIGIFIFASVGTGILSKLFIDEPEEPENFHCYINEDTKTSNELRSRCYKKYDEQYNKNLPLYGFALLDFLLVLLVCVVYSQFVRRRVDELDNFYKEYTETRNGAKPPRTSLKCKVFTAYVGHLLIRSVLMTVFLVLQWTVIYPITFPEEFTCFNRINNSTSTENMTNKTSTTTSEYRCDNPQAKIKTICGTLMFAVTALFLFFSLLELVYLHCKAKANYTEDENFCIKHLLIEGGRIKKFQDILLEQIERNTEFFKTPVPSNVKSRNWKLDEIFVTLVIQAGRNDEARSSETEDGDRILNAYAMPDKFTFQEPMKMFSPSKVSEDITDSPRTVLAVGRAGIGKSCLSKKILREWAKMKTNQKGQHKEAFKQAEEIELVKQIEFDDRTTEETVKRLNFAFLLEFRNLNNTRQISLKDLLRSSSFSVSFSSKKVLKHILKNPQNILLIFDGLDKAKNIGQGIKEEEAFHNSDNLRMPVGALFAKLVKGRLLSGATVLTTTRPSALSDNVVSDLYFKNVNSGQLRQVEILGFTYQNSRWCNLLV